MNHRDYLRGFWPGFIIGTAFTVSCAGIQYRHYGLSLPDECYQKGSLLGKLGKDGWPDVPFSQCKPDDVVKGKCVIELEQDYFSKDSELNNCREALDSCQRTC